MKHQLKTISIKAITGHTTHAILEEIHDSRNGEGKSTDDPEALAIQENLAALREKNAQTSRNQPDKRRTNDHGFSDEEHERIIVRKESKDESPDEDVEGHMQKETDEEKRWRQYKHHQYINRWGLLLASEGRDEEWFISSPPILDKSDPEYLCDMCRHIDFKILLTERGLPGNQKPGPTSIEFWDLCRVMNEHDCSFCNLIRRKLVDERASRNLPAEDPTPHSLRLNVLDEGPEYALQFEIEIGDVGYNSRRIVIQKLASPDKLPLQGLLVRQDAADMERLNGWLQTCEEAHPRLENSPHQLLGPGPSTLRMIDTNQNCVRLVAMPCQYACLSYVWGKATQTMLATNTRQVLETPGGLTNSSVKLDQTIKDALQVTRRVGLRYIWIDALCMLQDDAEEKTSIISQMGSIYGNSMLTIVASTNSNPTDGLPGIGSARGQAQVVEKVQGMLLAAAFHDPRQRYFEIEDSVWNSRAWTFQERHLSQRSVYFTNSQMCFTCPHGATFEDTVPVPDTSYRPPPLDDQTKWASKLFELQLRIFNDPTQYRYPNKAFTSKGESTVILRAQDPNNPDEESPEPAPVYRISTVPDTERDGLLRIEGETLWKAYSDAVNKYTKRNLTWQSDAVNAFTGVAALISQGVNTKFWYGLPEFAFDQALLWQPREALKRRGTVDAVNFPSWSWAAWEGHSSYHGRGWHNAITFAPVSVVKWLRKDDVFEYMEKFKASGDKTPELIEMVTRLVSNNKLLLVELDPYRLMKFENVNDGWKDIRDEIKNEHILIHDSYPGIRFTYPISLPGETLTERPAPDGALYFTARTTAVQFCDMPNTEYIQEGITDQFLQIGLNNGEPSAKLRRPWQHIIYHQGYRAGFLSLNIPFSEIDLSQQDKYSLVAISRDGLPHIAPPGPGWDWYWKSNPRMMQYMIYFNEEWGDNAKMDIPLPDWEKKPETDMYRENGDPHWDEGRFGEVEFFDVYNVLLVEQKGDYAERIGVGKVNYRAFRYAKPKEKVVVLR